MENAAQAQEYARVNGVLFVDAVDVGAMTAKLAGEPNACLALGLHLLLDVFSYIYHRM